MLRIALEITKKSFTTIRDTLKSYNPKLPIQLLKKILILVVVILDFRTFLKKYC